jgi:hypothetical protein
MPGERPIIAGRAADHAHREPLRAGQADSGGHLFRDLVQAVVDGPHQAHEPEHRIGVVVAHSRPF